MLPLYQKFTPALLPVSAYGWMFFLVGFPLIILVALDKAGVKGLKPFIKKLFKSRYTVIIVILWIAIIGMMATIGVSAIVTGAALPVLNTILGLFAGAGTGYILGLALNSFWFIIATALKGFGKAIEKAIKG